MKQFILAAIMLCALTVTKATAQGTGLVHPVRISQRFDVWQQFAAPTYFTSQTTMNGLGFTPVVINDTDNTLQLNPILYAQSDFVTARQRDSASSHKDTASGYYLLVDNIAAHFDTIILRNSFYFTGQIMHFLSNVTTNDSTIIKPVSGNINGASTYMWTQASTGTYKHVEIYYDGTNYFILK